MSLLFMLFWQQHSILLVWRMNEQEEHETRDTGTAIQRKKERKNDQRRMVPKSTEEERGSSGVLMKKAIATEQLSAQASDASLPWQHRISGLRGNG